MVSTRIPSLRSYPPFTNALVRGLAVLLVCAQGFSGSAQTLQPDWPQPNGPVFSTAVYGDTLIIGGEFSLVGATARTHIAAFNAITGELLPWAPFIFGNAPQVNHLQVVGDTLFAGGHFNRAIDGGSIANSNIAAFDLNTGALLPFWSTGTWVPPLFDINAAEVFAFDVQGGAIHVAGRFTGIQPAGPGLGNPVTFRDDFAVLDLQTESVFPIGSVFAPLLTNGGTITTVKALGDRFLFGGMFTQIGGALYDNLLMADKTAGILTGWDAQPTPVTLTDTALMSFQLWPTLRNVLGTWNDRFIVSGDFDQLRGEACGHLALVDTVVGGPLMSWHTNVNGRVNAIAIEGNTGYICGDFTSVGGQARNGLAAVDMSTGAVRPWAPPAVAWERFKSISVHEDFIFVGNGIAPPYLLAYARKPTTGPLPNGICSSFPLDVTFTANNTFNPGNVFTAELSDAVGLFNSPVAIGSIASTTGGTIPCSIPLNTPSGTGYRVRIRSSDPPLIGAYHLPSMIVQASSAWYADVDGDGYGDPDDAVYDCQFVPGRVLDGSDDCPALPGRVGTPCDDNDFFTFGDTIRNDCVCHGGRFVELHLVTDANGAQTSWEIRSDVDGYVVRSGPASPYADQADVIETFYLPIGCYRLRVYDSGGDGIVGGGYSLRDQVYGSMFIDNLNNGGFGSSSAIINDGAFCMDVSNDLLILTQRDKETWIIDDQMIAHENGAVSAQWGIGDQTDDGYQFWFFDPNGSYSRRVFRDHATSGGLGPANALRASRLALASIVSQPLPTGLLLNVKVRTKVNGIFGPWGSATRFRLLSTAPMCPMTQLSSTAPYTSCGTVRNLDGSDRVWAVPATRPNGNGGVQVADHYRFQWSLPSEGYLRNIVSASPALILSVWATNPLIPCRMYDVRVQASFDGGLTYCPWGPACQVYIFGSGCGDFQGGDHRAAEVSDVTGPLNLFPNPCAGDRFFITLPKEPEVDGAALVEVLDLAGKLVASRSITIAADLRNYEVTLDRPLGQGVYTARITIAGREQGSIRFGVVR